MPSILPERLLVWSEQEPSILPERLLGWSEQEPSILPERLLGWSEQEPSILPERKLSEGDMAGVGRRGWDREAGETKGGGDECRAGRVRCRARYAVDDLECAKVET
eukprot:351034-Chlamydomonas_euryale.AAC.9